VKGLEKCYPQVLTEEALTLMGVHTRIGWTKLLDATDSWEDDESPREEVEKDIHQMFELELGTGIIRNAPANLIRRALPMSSFTLSPAEKHWIVRCRSLRRLKTGHGTLYHSPHKPTVTIDGNPLKIAFTRHGLAQLADRIAPGWNSHYIGQNYVFGFLYECVYFETTRLLNGQPAFVVYNSCLRIGEHIRNKMMALTGVKTNDELAPFYYKVGYCPLVIDKDLAIAKTFLTPGYWQTPERKTLSGRHTAKFRRTARDIEQASDEGINTMNISTCNRTWAAVRWFHDHGVPQAKKIKTEVFRGLSGPYAELAERLAL
jgi:hypothetical protein